MSVFKMFDGGGNPREEKKNLVKYLVSSAVGLCLLGVVVYSAFTGSRDKSSLVFTGAKSSSEEAKINSSISRNGFILSSAIRNFGGRDINGDGLENVCCIIGSRGYVLKEQGKSPVIVPVEGAGGSGYFIGAGRVGKLLREDRLGNDGIAEVYLPIDEREWVFAVNDELVPVLAKYEKSGEE